MYTDYVEYDYDDENYNNDDNYNNFNQNDNSNKIKKIAFFVLVFAIAVLLVIFIVKLVSNKNSSNVEDKSQLIISRDSISLAVGESYKLEADFWSSSNEEVEFDWETNDENIATVDEEGMVVGVGEGTAEISGNYGKLYKKTCVVTVTSSKVSVESISLGNDITLKLKQTMLLQVNVIPSNASVNDLIFESDNEEVVSVDNKGYVTANSIGSASITVTTEDGIFSDTIEVTVESDGSSSQVVNPTRLVLFGLKDNLTIGNGSQMLYNVSPDNATNKTLTWRSSNSGIAVVNNSGYVTGVSAGKCTITATTTNGISSSVEIEVEGEVELEPEVTEPEPTEISVQGVSFKDGASLSMKVNATKLLGYTITPENATNKKVTFKSSDSSVVMVNSNGLVAAIKKGKANVTITTLDGSKTATIAITVN